MFQPARWKAYLRNLQSAENDSEGGNGADKSIYHIFHSQMLWFTRDEANGHNKIAGEHLKRCDAALEDCTMIVDALEEKLANTPKPSEVLDWYSLW